MQGQGPNRLCTLLIIPYRRTALLSRRSFLPLLLGGGGVIEKVPATLLVPALALALVMPSPLSCLPRCLKQLTQARRHDTIR